jgi:hypothetical protein
MAIVPSYLRPTTLAIAAPHGSQRVVTLPVKVVKAPLRVAVAARVLVAYSQRTGDVLDMDGDLRGVAVSVSVHHAAVDDHAVWADDEFAQWMLGIVAPNLLVANATVCPIIGMRVNLCIKYVGYFGTNPGTTGKFRLSTVSILSVFAKFTI